ncbi:WW domain-binding protein 5 [Heterocephalus glaber]|uniref:Transcription elongation factor A protein-like 9 n=1 Tax=Heterocephalus glaber TaxID=10181 RepID=G5ATD0_HETGA|nr:transcription elongation factor A protein-like 9 [Heterocephalus glaber]EHB00291.1 WW domain-binding protein 5 [Heterocephalus glaber]
MKPCQKTEEKPKNKNESKLEEEPKSGEKPEEEEKPEENFRERLIHPLQEFKEDIHNRPLSNEDMFREVDERDEKKGKRETVVHRKVN